ncbi:MAG: type II toxin-antitoxin system prevent-host-death family antitoxin [Caldilineales bacterium]|nr:type II toxin-antitoxin system prevent-host-death family antitoxin [Caldilineales bacterium]MCW5860552.1 type II toxin-antitoxin system prevent-host-death family antitoxin [Caldilineales bacterium]
MTTQVGVRELKTQLSRYLDEVKAGGVVIITEHGKPIGHIAPPPPAPSVPPTLAERMQALEEAGFLTQGRGKLEARMPEERLDTSILVSDLLLEDRT